MPYSKHLPKIMTEEDISILTETILLDSELYNNCPQGEFLKWRDITIIQLMFYTGMRPIECLNLRWEDIDMEKRKIKVRPYVNKIKTDLPVVMTIPAEKVIDRYLKKFQSFCINCEWMFPSVSSWKPMAECTMSDRFRKICKSSGLMRLERWDSRGKPCYTFRLYDLRHSFGTAVYNKTGSDIAVSRMLRHTRVASADVYTHLNFEDKKRIADSVFS